MVVPTPDSTPRIRRELIRGEPLDMDVLLDFATIDPQDIEMASEWWDQHASPEWVGALDSEPIEK